MALIFEWDDAGKKHMLFENCGNWKPSFSYVVFFFLQGLPFEIDSSIHWEKGELHTTKTFKLWVV